MRECRKCQESKSIEEFYKTPGGIGGRDSVCKECRKTAVLAKRHANIEHFREYDQKRGNHAKPGYVKAWRNRSKIKEQAHNRVSRAVAAGRIIKPESCEQCDAAKQSIHAHHDDYTKQLDVRWLCAPCHQRWHAKHGEAMNADMDPLPRGQLTTT